MQYINNKIQTIKYEINLAIYGYRCGEFLPVYSGGEMLNRNAFIAYKAKRVAKHTYRFTYSVITGLLLATAYILQQAAASATNPQ